MAFSVRLQGLHATTLAIVWSFDPVPWWDARALTKDARFEETSDRDTLYMHYRAVLAVEQARALERECAPRALPTQREDLARLEAHLARAADDGVGCVRVEIYEHESDA
jgi:hypothetical protein